MSKVFTENSDTISTILAHHTFMATVEMGIDIVDPLTTAQENYKYAVVAVEYFTKWIEAKSLVNIAAAGLKRYFCQNVICHFGLPRQITVDNAEQFNCPIFKDF
jgi:hypothetical protein